MKDDGKNPPESDKFPYRCIPCTKTGTEHKPSRGTGPPDGTRTAFAGIRALHPARSEGKHLPLIPPNRIALRLRASLLLRARLRLIPKAHLLVEHSITAASPNSCKIFILATSQGQTREVFRGQDHPPSAPCPPRDEQASTGNETVKLKKE